MCAYDERDFESGVLSQVDKQIAEYEQATGRHKAKKAISSSEPQLNEDSENSNGSADDATKPKTGQKRKSAENAESLQQKKSKMFSFDDTSQSNSSQANDAESLIKKGAFFYLV